MRSLIIMVAFVVSATAHAAKASTQDTPLKALQRIEFLLSNQQKQDQQDRDELYAQERCHKSCRDRYGEWDEQDTQDRLNARKTCQRKCADMPSPPGYGY